MGVLEFNFGYLTGHFSKHSHRDCYEFHYILSGNGNFIQNRKSTAFVKDQFFTSPPNREHSLEINKELSFFYIQYYPDPSSLSSLEKLKDSYLLDNYSRVTLSRLRALLSGDHESLQAAEHLFLYFIFTLLSESKVPEYNQEPIIKSQNYLMENITNKLTLQQISDHVHLEKHYFCRLFKKSTNISPLVYFEKLKMEAACSMINQGHRNYQIAENLGYCDETYFCSRFKKIIGISPGQFRQKNHLI
jgi:AraC-like DNA-binding protein